jgi:hypothetical protein
VSSTPGCKIPLHFQEQGLASWSSPTNGERQGLILKNLKANTPKLTYWEAMLFLCKYTMEHNLQCRSWDWELLGGFGLEMHLGYKEMGRSNH